MRVQDLLEGGGLIFEKIVVKRIIEVIRYWVHDGSVATLQAVLESKSAKTIAIAVISAYGFHQYHWAHSMGP